MPRIHIPAVLRRLVVERANGRCEYCLIHQDDVETAHHLDHIKPLKHGGLTISENLALACQLCNRYKGSDWAAADPLADALTPLFNPRTQAWHEHFQWQGIEIVGISRAGRATVELLRLNQAVRLLDRERLSAAGRYPPVRIDDQ